MNIIYYYYQKYILYVNIILEQDGVGLVGQEVGMRWFKDETERKKEIIHIKRD